ncbi:GNAT family N-acetyltransferase [Clostridium sp.]
MNICIVEKSINEIVLIKPLWEKLNFVHLDKSIYFKDKFEKFTFDKRVKSIYEKAQSGTIKIDMLWNSETENYVGYCLSSINDNLGEIESIYIEDHYRKFGLGGKLMESSLKWFELNEITNIQIGVVYSNDEALVFYKRYGFYVGNYILKRK